MTAVVYASTRIYEVWGGPQRYVAIVIHDTDAQFKKAAQAYSPHSDIWAEAVGGFHPVDHREFYNIKTKKWEPCGKKGFAGVIRTSKEWLFDDTIVHECVHAAAHIFRMDVRPVVNLGRGCEQNEEYFAYIVGDLTASVSRALSDKNLW